ncbi:MAG: DUF192 domain-containing protein [Candidatus Omnitrophota bacterium]|nr:DUF192 domain-containing protein [Candidatus Omnitrophota bacterium]
MRLINQTKNTILAETVYFADTPCKRIKGLLGRKNFASGEALIIKPCNAVHTFFMRFPIDLLFVDKTNKVLKVISNLTPFRLSPVYFRSCLVVELPAGRAKSTFTSQGDQLVFSP